MIDAYNDYQIYFDWDCQVHNVEQSSLSGFSNLPWEVHATFSDGINIFFLPDDFVSTAYGRADKIPSLSFYVRGLSDDNSTLTRLSPVLIHEMGHCLGLFHTDESSFNGNAPTDGSQCYSTGDCICETNPDTGQGITNDTLTCEWTGSDLFEPPVNNFMTLNFHHCLSEFTDEQVLRMKGMPDCFPPLQNQTLSTIYVDQDVIWDESTFVGGDEVTFLNDIIITNNARLTISENLTLKFAKGKGIRVIGGSMLILRGTLTSGECDGTWKDVAVSGKKSLVISYFPAKNTNAETAILFDNFGSVVCNSTYFYNNRISLYTWNNGGNAKIRDCAFIADDNFAFNSFQYFTRFNNMNLRADIRGGYFRNDFIDNIGVGISSSNSRFIIAEEHSLSHYGLPISNRTTFTGLDRGVVATSGSDVSVSVEKAVFEDCNIGILVNEVNPSKIIENTFNVSANQTGILYQGYIPSFICEENDFIGDSSGRGIQCDNTGQIDKVIRRNNFRNLTIGNVAVGNNGDDLFEMFG